MSFPSKELILGLLLSICRNRTEAEIKVVVKQKECLRKERAFALEKDIKGRRTTVENDTGERERERGEHHLCHNHVFSLDALRLRRIIAAMVAVSLSPSLISHPPAHSHSLLFKQEYFSTRNESTQVT